MTKVIDQPEPTHPAATLTTLADPPDARVAQVKGTVQRLQHNKIKCDLDVLLRAVNADVADDYAEAMKRGDLFPPVICFFDGKFYWLADGQHRLLANKKNHFTVLDVDVRQGGRRDAMLHAVKCNLTHGLPLTRDDKRRAVLRMLGDKEWSAWSDRQIGQWCGVDGKTVGSMRAKSPCGNSASSRKFTSRHGTVGHRKPRNSRRSPTPADAVKTRVEEGREQDAGVSAAVANGVDTHDVQATLPVDAPESGHGADIFMALANALDSAWAAKDSLAALPDQQIRELAKKLHRLAELCEPDLGAVIRRRGGTGGQPK